MAHKLNKGKNITDTSSSALVSALSLLPPFCVAVFENSFRHRIMVNQYVYDHIVASELHIPKIVDLMKFQETNNCLKVSADYNEDLIRVFYDMLESRQ